MWSYPVNKSDQIFSYRRLANKTIEIVVVRSRKLKKSKKRNYMSRFDCIIHALSKNIQLHAHVNTQLKLSIRGLKHTDIQTSNLLRNKQIKMVVGVAADDYFFFLSVGKKMV